MGDHPPKRYSSDGASLFDVGCNHFNGGVQEMKTVGELFEEEKITKDMVADVADESGYWLSASTFVSENWDTPCHSLMQKQAGWMSRILDDMVEKRIEGKI